MAGDDDDKPKRSWSEIDKLRDKSSHRRESGGGGGGGGGGRKLENTQAYRSYKTQLNKLFDGGGLPEALKSKLEDKGVGLEAKRKKELAAGVIAATTPSAIRAALEAYRAEAGFPDEDEALGKLLELEDVPVLLETIATIDRLHGEGVLKRGASLKARLKTAQMTVDSPKVTEACRALLTKL
jgi:hypothetical protein